MLRAFRGLLPSVDPSAYVDASAQVIGDVHIGPESSVWMNAVIRGDVHWIRIGARTNVQDGTVVHVADDGPCDIGADCIIGHRAMIHACRIEDACLIGMQATILDNAVVGAGSVVGAGALVTQRMVIPPRSTQPYQTETSSPRLTSPTTAAPGKISARSPTVGSDVR